MTFMKIVGPMIRAVAIAAFALGQMSGVAQAASGSGGGGGGGSTQTPFQARGTFPTNTNAGLCLMPNGSVEANILPQAVLRKSQGVWQFSMETVGADAEGTWTISRSVNGAGLEAQYVSQTFASGWAVVLGVIDQNQKGTYHLTGQATKSGSSQASGAGVGAVCTVSIDITI